jgi:WD40 repeat protein
VPRVLSGAFAGEPLYLDLRWARPERDLSLEHPRFKEAVALLAATLHGRSVEDMMGEEVAQHRRTTRIRNGAIAALSVLFLAAAVAAVVAVRQRAEAIRQRDLAVQSSLLNRVRSELEGGSLLEAVRTARASYQRFGAAPLALQTVREAASHPTASLNTFREPVDSRPRVSFSPDEAHILSLSENTAGSYAARIRDWRGNEVRAFGQIYVAEYAPDGSYLLIGWPWALQAAAEEDGSWCDNGMPAPPVTDYAVVGLQRFDLGPEGPPGLDLPMGFRASAPGDTLRVSVCGNYVHLDDANGTRLGSLRLPGVVDARFSPDGARLVAAARDRTAVHDLARLADFAGARVADLEGGAPVYSSDGNSIATVAGSTTIVWDASFRELIRRPGIAPIVGASGLLVTVDGDASLVWSAGAREPVRLAGIDPRLSPDGRWVMTTIDGQRTRIASVEGAVLTTLDGVSGRFARRAPVAMTVTASGVIRLWDLRRVEAATPQAAAGAWGTADDDLALLAPPAAGAPPGCSFECVSPDGATKVSVMLMGVTPGAPMSATLRFERASGSGADPAWEELPAATGVECLGPVAPLVFSPVAGAGLAFGCGDGDVHLYEPTASVRWSTKHDGAVMRAAFSADGRQLATASADRSARIWEAATGSLLATLGGHESEVVDAVFSPLAEHVATITSRGMLRVWARDGAAWSGTAEPIATIALPDDAVAAARFSADATQVLARTRRGFLRRWLVDIDAWLRDYAWVDEVSEPEARRMGLPPP